jgi:hypothetical protein
VESGESRKYIVEAIRPVTTAKVKFLTDFLRSSKLYVAMLYPIPLMGP